MFVSIPAMLHAGEVEITKLLVEYEQCPMGVETGHPRFSWQMRNNGKQRGYFQTAYQIKVTDSSGRLCWDSGVVKNGESLNVTYSGSRLLPDMRYDWMVEVWDQEGRKYMGKSWFVTGLMAEDDRNAAWCGASWIGTEDVDQVLYAHYLPVFRLGCTITFDQHSHSSVASILYGGNDERLMDKNWNISHLQAEKDSAFIQIELDAQKVAEGGTAYVNIYRRGYSLEDKSTPLIKSFPVSSTVINKTNLYDGHRVNISSNLGDTEIGIDGQSIGRLNINPMGKGGDFIAYPIVGDVGAALRNGQKASFSDFAISNYRSPHNRIAIVSELEAKLDGGCKGIQILIDPTRNSMPMLRTDFHIDKEVAEAKLRVTARGVYDCYINGQQIGSDYLNPGITQYNRTHLYQTFDVSSMLQNGKNVIGAILGEGWWSGGATYEGQNWNYFGDRLSLLAMLSITFKDGSRQVIASNPERWQYSVDGPVRYASLFQGEVYDARKEDVLWATANYDASRWKHAVKIDTDGHVSSDGWGNGPAPDNYSNFRLLPQFGQTIKEKQRLVAQSVNEVRPGVFIYDMGQNMVGVPDIRLSGLIPGTPLKVRYAEVLYPDLPEYEANKGMLMLENIRAAMAQDIYIAKGGEEHFSPRFTNHGYRYLEITGISEPLPLKDVEGIVLSSIDELTSYYTTSNPLVNQLWQNICWSTLGNFVSIPTDCPQRNERLGWAGDISVYSRTATYMAAVPQFLRRYLQAMRDVQHQDGRMPDVAPLGGGFGGLLWGSASITVAWESYQQYGDKVMLEEHYEAMKRYIDYILCHYIDTATNVIVQERAWGDLGDWLGLEDNKNDKSLFWETYLIYDLFIMQQVAGILGKAEDASHYAALQEERKAFFVRTYLRPSDFKTVSSGLDNPKGSLIDTQTSYVLPLALGTIEGDVAKRVAENLRLSVVRKGILDNGETCPPYSLLTGFIGTSWISKALSDAGYSDVAYLLLQQEDYPSWLYPVKQGATTIWERLNSYTHTDGFGGNNRMNSFNHYSFGAVGAWMYNYSLGIQRDETSPGFKHFYLRPTPDSTGKMQYAKGYYDSMYGRIESGWHDHGQQTDYRFSIPANTSATLFFPNATVSDVTEGGLALTNKIEGIKSIKEQTGTLIIELLSGKYNFKIRH